MESLVVPFLQGGSEKLEKRLTSQLALKLSVRARTKFGVHAIGVSLRVRYPFPHFLALRNQYYNTFCSQISVVLPKTGATLRDIRLGCPFALRSLL